MSEHAEAPRLHLPLGPRPERVTQPRPRRKPAEGAPPSKPLQMPVLPPRRIREVPSTVPAQPAPTEQRSQPAATAAQTGDRPAASAVLYRREAMQARWDLDGDELTELVRDGVVLEIPLGRLVRYAPAEHLPAGRVAGQPEAGAA